MSEKHFFWLRMITPTCVLMATLDETFSFGLTYFYHFPSCVVLKKTFEKLVCSFSIIAQKKTGIYLWVRGQLTKLTKLANQPAEPKDSINVYILSQAQASRP